MEDNANSIYNEYQSKQNYLLEFIEESKQIFFTLNMTEEYQTCQHLIDKLKEDTFKVLVLGEFKRGKSTFINALLKNELLPADIIPCTAVINEIKWGNKPIANLYIDQDLESLPKKVPKEVQDHFDNFLFEDEVQTIPPLKITIDQLEDYVKITDSSEKQANAIARSPYEKVEIFYPIEICRNGVEIIDSPGLNEHKTRSKVTTNYLSKADAVLFVMMASQLASKSEREVIEQLRELGHEEIFFIINRWDEVENLKDQENVKRFAKRSLSPLTNLGEDGLFYISALDALDGYLDEDQELIDQSNIVELENALAHFLTQERGRIKLLQPSKRLLGSIETALKQTIPQKLKMLETDYEELKQRYEEIKPLLQEAKTVQRKIHDKLEDSMHILEDQIKQKTQLFIFDFANYLEENKNSFTANTNFSHFNLNYKEQAEVIALEIVDKINQTLIQKQKKWQEEEIIKIIDNRLAVTLKSLQLDIRYLMQKLESASLYLVGESSDDFKEISYSEVNQLIDTALQSYMQDFSQYDKSYYGGNKEIVKSLATQLAMVTSLTMAIFSNPLGWVIAVIGWLITMGPLQNLLRNNYLSKEINLNQKIQEAVIQRYTEELQNCASAKSNEVAQQLSSNLQIITNSIDRALCNKIQTCQEQVESVLKTLSEQKETSQEVKENIENCRRELMQLQQECEKFASSQQR